MRPSMKTSLSFGLGLVGGVALVRSLYRRRKATVGNIMEAVTSVLDSRSDETHKLVLLVRTDYSVVPLSVSTSLADSIGMVEGEGEGVGSERYYLAQVEGIVHLSGSGRVYPRVGESWVVEVYEYESENDVVRKRESSRVFEYSKASNLMFTVTENNPPYSPTYQIFHFKVFEAERHGVDSGAGWPHTPSDSGRLVGNESSWEEVRETDATLSLLADSEYVGWYLDYTTDTCLPVCVSDVSGISQADIPASPDDHYNIEWQLTGTLDANMPYSDTFGGCAVLSVYVQYDITGNDGLYLDPGFGEGFSCDGSGTHTLDRTLSCKEPSSFSTTVVTEVRYDNWERPEGVARSTFDVTWQDKTGSTDFVRIYPYNGDTTYYHNVGYALWDSYQRDTDGRVVVYLCDDESSIYGSWQYMDLMHFHAECSGSLPDGVTASLHVSDRVGSLGDVLASMEGGVNTALDYLGYVASDSVTMAFSSASSDPIDLGDSFSCTFANLDRVVLRDSTGTIGVTEAESGDSLSLAWGINPSDLGPSWFTDTWKYTFGLRCQCQGECEDNGGDVLLDIVPCADLNSGAYLDRGYRTLGDFATWSRCDSDPIEYEVLGEKEDGTVMCPYVRFRADLSMESSN
ncbi:hypothetical protein KIPB_007327 [Kipferlia bialata]|uniref:Uncharacterized protein n=1 Tax=Kipferlia bialata TaxID=797122 RepID=A0A9K3D049_9EUKA|nr:hypothetical protein KIPB_007327 [Kipferlia bialata]|eukprot:g7327.t1